MRLLRVEAKVLTVCGHGLGVMMSHWLPRRWRYSEPYHYKSLAWFEALSDQAEILPRRITSRQDTMALDVIFGVHDIVWNSAD